MTTQDSGRSDANGRSSKRGQGVADLREQTRLQAALLDGIPHCIALILKKDTREIVASNKFAREIGAVPGRTCFVTCASRDDECPFCLAPKLWETGQLQRIEVEYRGRWYEGIWAPLSEDLYAHYIFDITERKQTEELLRRTQFVVDHSQDSIHWVDSEGRLLYVNDACCRRLGYSREELLGMTVSDIDPLAPRPWSGHFHVTGEGSSITFESQHRAKDGEIYPVEVTANYLNYGGREYSCAIAHDISDRKRVDRDLQIASHAVEHAALGVLRLDREGRIREVNGYLCQMLGYSREELLEMTVFDLDVGLEAHRWPQRWQEVKGRESVTVETAHRAKSGQIIPVEISRNIVEFEGEEFDHAFIRDIRERKQAEKTLLRSEEKFSRAFHGSPGSMAISTFAEGRFIDVNDSFLQNGGYEWEEVIGRTASELGLWDDPKEAERLRNLLQEHGSVSGFEHAFRRKSGEIGYGLLSAATIDIDGEPCLLTERLDITERKRAENALKESEERYRQLVESAHDWIWEIDEHGVYVFASPKVGELLGYEPAEVLGKTPFDFMPPDEAERIAVVFSSIAAKREPFRDLANTNLHKDGHRVFLETTGMPVFDSSGDYRGYRGLDRDVTERKLAEEALRQSEEQLRQSQKMEAVGQLAGGIAHDFNNLLTAILGYSEMILASKASTLDEVRADVEEIKHAGERASVLTQQIMAFSRRQILRPAALSLNEVIEEMKSLLGRTLGEDINLVTLEHPHLDLTEVDRHQFEQVLMNLALNARDAMPSGGRLTLETGNVELDEEYCRTHPEVAPGSYVMLSVCDTGVGMDLETMDHAFEPFFTTKAFGEGSGLGLAVIHGIVRQSNGSIFVHSEPGKGATFKIYLPRVGQPDISEEVVIPTHASARGHETIMVVEDEAGLRGLIERILGGAGYTTHAFGSANEAVEALGRGEHSVDLLLTDVMLPGSLQGHELARAVLVARPDLPVLYISGYTRDALVHAGRLDEAVNLLEKPFTPEALATMVRQVLDQPQCRVQV